MGRKRSPERDAARQLWSANPQLSLQEIADAAGVSCGLVRKWKNQDNWEENMVTNVTKNVTKKDSVTKSGFIDEKLIDAAADNTGLSDMEELFCLHYVKTKNGTASAVKAGYSDQYPNRQAYTLLGKKKIQDEIRRLKKLRLSLELAADGQDVVEQYMKIAFADITDFASFKGSILTLKNSADVDGTIISEVKEGRDGVTIKLADRMKALAFLERYFELNPTERRRAEYEKRRLELEEIKTEAAVKKEDEGGHMDDGFPAAMNAGAAGIWADGEDDDMGSD